MIIVTGGAGFIGSNIIRGLNQMGIEDILVVDNLSNAQKHLNLNTLRIFDFIDKQSFLQRLPHLKNVTTIFHQGACSSTTETDGVYMMHNNYEFSKEILHYCLDRKVDFLYASSASVYGNGENGFREERPCEYPLNVYAFSKFMFDNYVRRILSGHSLKSQVLGLRYFNVYGYQENHKGAMASVIFHFYNQLKQGGKMRLFEGSASFLRDFIFVEDVVSVNQYFFESRQDGIFNCGTGQARSFTDIAGIISNLESQSEIEVVPFPDHLKGKYQAFTQADLTNLKVAGYKKEFTSLEEGVTAYYQMLKDHNGLFNQQHIS